MRTGEAVLLMAKLLGCIVDCLVLECDNECAGCEQTAVCDKMVEAREINTELQSLLTDKRYVLNAVYAEGFEDADRGARLDNPYNSTRETDLFAQYNRGYFDGAV